MNVLITGGSRGLGFNIVNLFLENGWNVYNVSRTRPEITSYNFHHLSFDLSNVEMVKQKIFKEFITNKIPIHAVVHNAAVAYDDIVTNAKIAPLKSMFDVNVLTPIMMNNYAIKNMLFNQIEGSVVFISSISSTTGYKGLSMYASTKGALESHCKNLAREWGPRGIRFNCVVPGFMQTEMSSGLSKEQRNRIYNRTSLKRETSIDSVSNTVLFLCSEGASSITGEKIYVDNGTI